MLSSDYKLSVEYQVEREEKHAKSAVDEAHGWPEKHRKQWENQKKGTEAPKERAKDREISFCRHCVEGKSND